MAQCVMPLAIGGIADCVMQSPKQPYYGHHKGDTHVSKNTNEDTTTMTPEQMQEMLLELQRQNAALTAKLQAATKSDGVTIGVSKSGLVELRISAGGKMRRLWAEPEAIETLFAHAQPVAKAIAENRDKFRQGPDDPRFAEAIQANKAKRDQAAREAAQAKTGQAATMAGQVKVAL